MNKKILGFIFSIIIIVCISSLVYGADVENNSASHKIGLQDNYNFHNISIESKTFTHNNTEVDSKIHKILISNSIFKSGTHIYLKIYTDKTIKHVSGQIPGKNSYKFTKTKLGYWHYKLNTKNLKTGVYKIDIKAIDNKNEVYKSSTYLTADNVPPKLLSISTNVKTINAGNSFTIYATADNSTKKIVAYIRGQNYSLKLSNDNQWSVNVSLSYKEINTILISVKAYNSLGNFAKKEIYIVSKPKIVYWNGSVLTNKKYKVSYPNPSNAYEKSIYWLSQYATVFEGYAVDQSTLGITYKINKGKHTKYNVTIAYKDPFIVYHELAHVLHWDWNEYTCDVFAYNKTGYWVK